ncbi:MAG: hypothetical protein ACRDAX_09105 [Propionibacteriaceae bacterium]
MTTDVRRYDLPYGALVPAIVNDEVGINRIVARGDADSYRMEVTLLDAPDHRLVRAGVVLAHRVFEGVGEWYLAAPGWQPYLPVEAVESVGEDLPTTFAALVEPFRRGAALGPAAGMSCQRTEYGIRGHDDAVIALLRDELVTVTRSGLTTARYREVTVTRITGNDEQMAWITEALSLIGGAEVSEFPSFVRRLGAPATGLSDLPVKRRGQGDDTLESYVQSVLGRHLRSLIKADLALRSGHKKNIKDLKKALERLRRDLWGLHPVLDQEWQTDLVADIDLLRAVDENDDPARVRAEIYSSVLERLVQATRAPRLGPLARDRADEVLAQSLRDSLRFFLECGAKLGSGDDQAWVAALSSARNARAVAEVCAPLLGKKADRAVERMTQIVHELEWSMQVSTAEPIADIEGLDPLAAFRLGRSYERDVLVQQAVREDFIDHWERHARKVARLVAQ